MPQTLNLNAVIEKVYPLVRYLRSIGLSEAIADIHTHHISQSMLAESYTAFPHFCHRLGPLNTFIDRDVKMGQNGLKNL